MFKGSPSAPPRKCFSGRSGAGPRTLRFPTDTQISLQTTRGETLGSAESKLSLACKRLETEGFGWAGDSNTLTCVRRCIEDFLPGCRWSLEFLTSPSITDREQSPTQPCTVLWAHMRSRFLLRLCSCLRPWQTFARDFSTLCSSRRGVPEREATRRNLTSN